MITLPKRSFCIAQTGIIKQCVQIGGNNPGSVLFHVLMVHLHRGPSSA